MSSSERDGHTHNMARGADPKDPQGQEDGAALYVSISSIRDETFRDTRETLAELDRREVTTALLVAPHVDYQWHLAKDERVRGWLHEQHAVGRTLIANGFDTSPKGRRSEFATLARHEARLRLTGAQRQMHSMGFDLAIFAPPRWRLSDGTLEVLPEFPFQLALSRQGAFRLHHGHEQFEQVLAARALSIGEGYGTAGWWRRNVIAASKRMAGKGKPVRISASAHDLGVHKNRRDLLAAVDACLEQGARPADYADLIA